MLSSNTEYLSIFNFSFQNNNMLNVIIFILHVGDRIVSNACISMVDNDFC